MVPPKDQHLVLVALDARGRARFPLASLVLKSLDTRAENDLLVQLIDVSRLFDHVAMVLFQSLSQVFLALGEIKCQLFVYL